MIHDRRNTIVRCLANLGWVALLQGDYTVAIRHFGESLTLFRELGDRDGIANCLNNLGQAAAGLGDVWAAEDYFRGALAEAMAIGRLPLVLGVLAEVAGLWAKAGEYARAAELIGLALGHPATGSDVAQDAEPVLSALRAVLPVAQLEAALERGKSLDLDAVVAELLAEIKSH